MQTKADRNNPWSLQEYRKRPSALPYEDRTGAAAADRADKGKPWKV